MIENPHLFLKAIKAKEAQEEAQKIKTGLEGQWVKDMKIVTAILSQLIRQAPELFNSGQSQLDRRFCITAFNEAKKLINELDKQIAKAQV